MNQKQKALNSKQNAMIVDEIKAAGFIVYRIIQENIQYLLLQSSKNPHHWTPPKGHLEPNETELQAAYRETFEESSLKSDQLRVHDDPMSIRYQVNGKNKLVTYWLAEMSDPEAVIVTSCEHQDFRWASFDEAKKLMQFENLITLLNEAHQILAKRLNK
ncbi:hypothetical protein GE061_014984 [Apolygus lucorum]|uniref:Bis(5'-nucleosyl)-tetraphosphatase [asymmetrical] n=1 Tax=Apolygus lucorum TaxID=248454 RepID=A0A6A4IS34_APOLU|nr:hypothetical protein GE061_014984 [Apolygus lucorum]